MTRFIFQTTQHAITVLLGDVKITFVSEIGLAYDRF